MRRRLAGLSLWQTDLVWVCPQMDSLGLGCRFGRQACRSMSSKRHRLAGLSLWQTGLGLGLFADGRFGVGMSLWTTGVPKYVQ
jgi:hypothetical protein